MSIELAKRRNAGRDFPGRASQPTTRRIAVLVDTATSWGRGVLRGINSYALKHGPWEIFVEPRGLEERLRMPAGWRGDGVIARVGQAELARELKALGLPVVNVSGIELPEAAFPRVATDLRASGALAARHFLERGFRHFAYFSVHGLRYVATHRDAFAQAVVAAGGDLASFAVKPMAGAEPDWGLDLAQLGLWVRSLSKPVAILCWNASSAREIVYACHEAGVLVPEEAAVLAQSDDEVLCETSLVPISGIAVTGEHIGHRAAEVLDGLFHRIKPTPGITLIPPLGIVARQSTDTLAVRDQALVKALYFIRQHAAVAVRVTEVARAAGVSRRVLERRFAEVLRRSPADEIRRAHLDRAKRLLVETDLPMPLVAEKAGLGSQAYLSYLFGRHIGVAPVRYRKENRLRLDTAAR